MRARFESEGMGRLAPALLLAIVVTSLVLAFLARGQITPETLAAHHGAVMGWRDANLPRAVAGFFLLYCITAVVSVPGIATLTLLGGYLFGVVWGTLLVASAATLGGTGLYLLTRAGLGDWLVRRTEHQIAAAARIVQGLRENQIKMMLLLRLAPVMPLFIANVLPALLGVRLRVFLPTTFFGIIPGSAVVALTGQGLAEVLAQGGHPDIATLAPLLVMVPAIILGIMLVIRILQWEPAG